MGVQSARFESAGKSSEHLVPGVYSRRATIAGETGVSANNLCIIGYSVGGKPKTLYELSDKSEAQLVLQNGQLLEAVANAFNGSSDYVPQKVYAMRVNAGTQSALELKSGVNTILKLKSANYGTWCNQIKFWLKDGSVAGTKKVLISFKGDDIVIDNIGKKLMTLMYIGGGERANATVTDTGMKLWATDANGETVDNFSYEWEEIETLYELIDIINSTGVYTATALVNEAETPSGLLDCANFELGESASILTANLDALIKALLNTPYIGEAELAEGASRVMPDNNSNYVFFSGAEAGSYSYNDWLAVFAELEKHNIQLLATPCPDHAVHVLMSNHCTEMTRIDRKKEVQFIVGCDESTSMKDALAYAAELNNELGSYVFNAAFSNNPFTGEKETIPPSMLACKAAGIEAALAVSNPLTNKVVKVTGFTRKFSTPEMNMLIAGGIMPFGENDEGELVCIRAVTTYQGDNLALNERSMMREALFIDRDLRRAFNRRVGTDEEPSESDILKVLNNKAKTWHRQNYITKADDGKLVFNAKVKVDGDKTYLTYEKFLRAPNNFLFITSINKVYSSTIEV